MSGNNEIVCTQASQSLVSVVILNYNGENLLGACIKSVLRSNYKNLEVIVVDNGSTDHSIEIAREIAQENKNVMIITNSRNLGFSKGNNIGINMARGKYVVLLNNDTEVDEDWLDEIVTLMELNPNVGVCEGKILVDNKVTYPGFAFNPYFGFAKMPEQDKGQYDYCHEIFSAKGVCVVLRRSLLKKVGLLDPFLWITAEILDLCWRFNLAGYKVLYVPKSVIHHKARLGYGSYPMHVKKNVAFHVTKNQTMILIKNLSLKNLIFKSLPVVIVLRLLELVYLMMKEKKVILLIKIKACGWLFKNFRYIWRQRLWIQRFVRRVPDDRISRVWGKPNFLEIYRFYRKDNRGTLKYLNNVRVPQDKKAEMDFWSKAASLKEPEMTWLFEHLEHVKWQGLLLDAGCGRGGNCSVLQRYSEVEFIGVDISIETLRAARRKTQSGFVLGDLENLPFKDEAFDTVLCTATLHHFPDIVGAVGELARALRKGGQLVLAEPNDTPLNKLSNTTGKFLSRYYVNQIRSPNETLHNVEDYLATLHRNQLARFILTSIHNAPTLGEEMLFFLRKPKSMLSFFILMRALLRRLFLIVPSVLNCNNVIITVTKEI